MLRNLWSFGCGLVFSAGLVVSGMVRPSKVIAFLDFTSGWDPSLAFVMISAIAISAIAWRLAARRSTPILGGAFPPPAPRNIDAKLIGGSALFGLGWGLAGYCPGPALTATATGLSDGLLFVGAMLLGFRLYQSFERVPVDEATNPVPAAPVLASNQAPL